MSSRDCVPGRRTPRPGRYDTVARLVTRMFALGDWAILARGEREPGSPSLLFWGATPQTPTVLAPPDAGLGALAVNQHGRPLPVDQGAACGRWFSNAFLRLIDRAGVA